LLKFAVKGNSVGNLFLEKFKICRFLQTNNNSDGSKSAPISVDSPTTTAPSVQTDAEFDKRIEIDPFTQKGPYPLVKTRPLTVPANLKFDDVRPVYARLPDYKDGFALVQGGHFLPKSFEKN
jgi:hypothetical protein